MTQSIFKKTHMILGGVALCTLTACQTLPMSRPQAPTPIIIDANNPKFNITGKIGIITVQADRREAVSAFYAWGQDGERFAIDLTGALGLGATSIRFDGKTATLVSEQTGTLTADSPEALLKKATGWQAPISHLPYWVLGKNAPDDTNTTYDAKDRPMLADNGEWAVQFDYAQDKPSPYPFRLRINHQAGHRVVLTITHQ